MKFPELDFLFIFQTFFPGLKDSIVIYQIMQSYRFWQNFCSTDKLHMYTSFFILKIFIK